MSDAYQRIMNARKKPVPEHQKIKNTEEHHPLDQQQSKADIHNIFSDSQIHNQTQLKPAQEAKPPRKRNSPEKHKKKAQAALAQKKQVQDKKEKLEEKKGLEKQVVEQKKIPAILELEEDVNTNKRSVLNLGQSINLSLGHFMNPYSFPLKRQIPIIANIQDEEREKYENGTYISEAFDNNLRSSFFLFFFSAVFFPTFLRIPHLLWLLAVILSFLIPEQSQYSANRYILLAIYGFYCFFGIIFQLIATKNRRNWTEKINDDYKVYHYDQRQGVAEWVLTSPLDLRPGNIFKISLQQDTVLPTDCIIIHSNQPIIQADQSSILEYLSPLQKQERIVYKQSLIRSSDISLPLTGVIEYQLFAPEVRQQCIVGRLILQQPFYEKYNVTYNQILIRGSKIVANKAFPESQVLCAVLETGIDSLILKYSQYPYQYRPFYSTARRIDIILIIISIFYILIVGAGILTGYIFTSNSLFNRGFYIQNYSQSAYIDLAKITLHHFTNYIIFVPLLLKIIYLVYMVIQTQIIQSKMGITFRDKEKVHDIKETGILVTTLVSDLPRSNMNSQDEEISKIVPERTSGSLSHLQKNEKNVHHRQLHSIKVQQLYHNFTTTPLDEQNYNEEDIQLMGYFMSISLLSCTHSRNKQMSPLEMGISEQCKTSFNIKAQLPNPKKNNFLKIGDFNVIELMKINPTNKHPFKILFYKYSKPVVEVVEEEDLQVQEGNQESSISKNESEKVLCLIRGQVSEVTEKFYRRPSNFVPFSEKLHQQKGQHIEVLAKSVLSLKDFENIKSAIEGESLRSSNKKYSIQEIYNLLQNNLLQTQLLGLLIWENPYVPSISRPPISSLPQPQFKIIIAPQSRFEVAPEFHSIHTITNYLLKTFKMPVSQLTNKILHEYTNIDDFVENLVKERVLVLNGWDYRVIKQMLVELKGFLASKQNNTIRKNKLLGYIEHDEYAWILKETDFSVAREGDGFDLDKYPDMIIKNTGNASLEEASSVFKKLYLFSVSIKKSISNLVLTQFRKAMILITIEFIGSFYTWGTGLAIITTPLYLVLEIILLLDIFYYLVFNIQKGDIMLWNADEEKQRKAKQTKNYSKNRKLAQKEKQMTSTGLQSPTQIIFQTVVAVLAGCFITFIPIYSMTEPIFSQGTAQSQNFLRIAIHFILVHALILPKLFFPPYTISLFRILILLIQMGLYYVGVIVISEFDTYNMRGIIWYCFSARIVLICVFCVWILTSLQWIWFMMKGISRSNTGRGSGFQGLKKEEKGEQVKGLILGFEEQKKQ